MALGHSPIPFPTGKANNSPKRKYSAGIAFLPVREEFLKFAKQLEPSLMVLTHTARNAQSALMALDKAAAESLCRQAGLPGATRDDFHDSLGKVARYASSALDELERHFPKRKESI